MALSVRKSSRVRKEPSRYKDYEGTEPKQGGGYRKEVKGGNNKKAGGRK